MSKIASTGNLIDDPAKANDRTRVGTLKHWMGMAHFLTKGINNVGTEICLHVLAYNLKRVRVVTG